MRLNNPIGGVHRPVLAELAGNEDIAFNPVSSVRRWCASCAIVRAPGQAIWEDLPWCFYPEIMVCHDFNSLKNGALQDVAQITPLEGAFDGII